MSITDELRACGVYRFPSNRRVFTEEELTAIADRIDAEHDSACAEAYGNGVQSVTLPDMTAYAKLPLDADGEYIHIGDVMEWVSPYEDYKPVIRTVDAVGEQAFFAWSKDSGRYAQYEARAYRHYHAPTVEDVLTELLNEAEHFHSLEEERDAIAEYAAKLRLAGDAE